VAFDPRISAFKVTKFDTDENHKTHKLEKPRSRPVVFVVITCHRVVVVVVLVLVAVVMKRGFHSRAARVNLLKSTLDNGSALPSIYRVDSGVNAVEWNK
jgi:hypothetical protein